MTHRKIAVVPESVTQIIIAVSDRMPNEIAEPLREQLRVAAVLSEEPGRSIDLSVPTGAPKIPALDGPLPVSPSVVDEEGALTGEVLLWVKTGLLIGLECPWFTDEPPSEWPSTSSLDFTEQ